MSVGSLLGPPLGGILYHLGGWELPFHALGVAGAMILIPSTMVVTDTDKETPPPAPPLELLKVPRVAALVASVFLVGWSCSAMEPVLPIYLSQEFGTQPVAIGCILMAFTLAHAGSGPVAGLLEPLIGRIGVTALGLSMSGIFLPLVPLAADTMEMLGVLVLAGLSGGLVLAFAMPELTDALEALGCENHHATVYALFDTGYGAGMVSGAIAGGSLYEWGIKAPLITTGALTVVASPILYIHSNQERQQQSGEGEGAEYEAVCAGEESDQEPWEVSRYHPDAAVAHHSGGHLGSVEGSYQGGMSPEPAGGASRGGGHTGAPSKDPLDDQFEAYYAKSQLAETHTSMY